MKYKELYNGVKMPILGLGTARNNGDSCRNMVSCAIKLGYRLIDTARMYDNEIDIYKGIIDSKINRNELFITTKLDHEVNTYTKALDVVNKTLKNLNTTYLDLVLIHEPFSNDIVIYKALEDLYDKGIIKAIGVSNFSKDYLIEFIKKVRIKPMINQVEYHILHQQFSLKEYLDENDISLESYAPFMSGFYNIKDLKLDEMALKYHKTVYQIILKYIISNDVICIPKAQKLSKLKENYDIFEFELEKKDINYLKNLNKNMSFYGWD